MDPTDNRWRRDAACVGDGRFFANVSDNNLRETLTAICDSCPVRVTCEAMLFFDEPEKSAVVGFRAGMSQTERQGMKLEGRRTIVRGYEAILLMEQGYTSRGIATLMDTTIRTVERWKAAYRQWRQLHPDEPVLEAA